MFPIDDIHHPECPFPQHEQFGCWCDEIQDIEREQQNGSSYDDQPDMREVP